MHLHEVHVIIESSIHPIALHQRGMAKSLICKAHANLSEQISRYSLQWADIIHE